MPCKRPGLRMAFLGFQTSGPVFSGCSDQVWPSGRWPSGDTGAFGLRWKGSRSRPSWLQELAEGVGGPVGVAAWTPGPASMVQGRRVGRWGQDLSGRAGEGPQHWANLNPVCGHVQGPL